MIQGYVHMEVCKLALSNNQPLPEMEDVCYTIYLVSRRSRFRAGILQTFFGISEKFVIECLSHFDNLRLVNAIAIAVKCTVI